MMILMYSNIHSLSFTKTSTCSCFSWAFRLPPKSFIIHGICSVAYKWCRIITSNGKSSMRSRLPWFQPSSDIMITSVYIVLVFITLCLAHLCTLKINVINKMILLYEIRRYYPSQIITKYMKPIEISFKLNAIHSNYCLNLYCKTYHFQAKDLNMICLLHASVYVEEFVLNCTSS